MKWRREHFSTRQDPYLKERDERTINRGWPSVLQHDRREIERRSPRRSPGRYPSWRRNSRECSPSPHVRSSPRNRSRSPQLPPGVPTKGRNLFLRSKSRSLSPRRRRSRSRSMSRGRGRHRNSGSPRRHSQSYQSGRRSSSYGSRKRFKRGSSSSDSSSADSHSRRSARRRANNDNYEKRGNDTSEDEEDGVYLHPVLNRAPKEGKVTRPPSNTQPVGADNVVASASSSAASLAALSQAYGNSPPKQTYTQQDIDDEDRFLYGEELGHPTEQPKKITQSVPAIIPIKQPAPEPVRIPIQQEITTKMTPGGFDSNALKNVLKAIGFNFEMSAQQTLTASPSTPVPIPDPPKPITPVPRPPQQMVERPQQIQTLQGGQVTRPKPAPQQVQVQPVQQYYQPYDPYSQPTNITYAPATPAAIQPAVNTSLGYPIHVHNPANPSGGVLVYQPVNTTQQPQTIYQHHQQVALSQPQPSSPQVLPAHTGSGRVVLPPHRPDTPEINKPSDARQERLKYLQLELEKLKKQQNELLRKKRKEKDGHKDPLIKKNTLLQAGVEEQIREIRQAAEKAAGIDSASESSGDEAKDAKEEKYDYFDPGNHWCKLCNIISTDLVEFLTHLHSKVHRKAINPYERPWNDEEQSKKKKADNCIVKALKGSEFLLPITGYFCTLCQTFSGDQICAEDHCKSYSHNTLYKKHCKKHPSYEKKFKKRKKALIQAMEDGGESVKVENVEGQVKYIDKSTNSTKEDQKIGEKESKRGSKEFKYSERVERVLKYIQNDGVQRDGWKNEQKKEKKHKTIRNDYSPDKYGKQERQSHFDSARQSHDKPCRDESKDERRSFKDEPKEGRRSFREDSKDDKKLPRKYSDDYRERSTDHSRRRRNRWSPGYDEYDKQQDDRYEVRHDKRKVDQKRSRHSRSRSRSREEKWIEKPQANNRKKTPEKTNKPITTSSAKVPTPGFGKFSWSSNVKTESNTPFDQVPVDTPVLPHEVNDSNKNGEFGNKGKIAIKITGKSQMYPPRLSGPTIISKSEPIFPSVSEKAAQEKKAAEEKRASMASELQRKVEALKRENALRTQLSSITLPAGRGVKPYKPKPNTAAVILGTRAMAKNNNIQLIKTKEVPAKKPDKDAPVPPPPPPVNKPHFVPTRVTRAMSKMVEPVVAPEIKVVPVPPMQQPHHEPPPPGLSEPLPPGEEGPLGDEDDGAISDASGISMEIASDED